MCNQVHFDESWGPSGFALKNISCENFLTREYPHGYVNSKFLKRIPEGLSPLKKYQAILRDPLEWLHFSQLWKWDLRKISWEETIFLSARVLASNPKKNSMVTFEKFLEINNYFELEKKHQKLPFSELEIGLEIPRKNSVSINKPKLNNLSKPKP